MLRRVPRCPHHHPGTVCSMRRADRTSPRAQLQPSSWNKYWKVSCCNLCFSRTEWGGGTPGCCDSHVKRRHTFCCPNFLRLATSIPSGGQDHSLSNEAMGAGLCSSVALPPSRQQLLGQTVTILYHNVTTNLQSKLSQLEKNCFSAYACMDNTE